MRLQPQLLACLLVKTYLNLDYRTAQKTLELSDGVREALGLTVVPDYSTLWRFAHDKATADVLARALEETVARFKQSSRPAPIRLLVSLRRRSLPSKRQVCSADELLATSSSAEGNLMRLTPKRPVSTENGPTRSGRPPADGSISRWTKPQLVLAQLSKPGPCGDYPDLPPLATQAQHAVGPMTVLADAGDDCESNHVFCRERLGVRTLIPAKTRRFVAGPRRRHRGEMVRLLGCATLGVAGEAETQHVYPKRWLVETLMSVVKHKWGEALRARSEMMQRLEALVRGVVYNVHRLVVLDIAATST